MLKKKSNKKGFTIMEMLIVVAIIAVLAAIAIPAFNGALTKSKEAADVANIRAAYAEIQVKVLTEGLGSTTTGGTTTDNTYKDLLNTELGTSGANLNYHAADHGYTFDEDTNTITYKANRLKTANNTDTFSWTFDASEIN